MAFYRRGKSGSGVKGNGFPSHPWHYLYDLRKTLNSVFLICKMNKLDYMEPDFIGEMFTWKKMSQSHGKSER